MKGTVIDEVWVELVDVPAQPPFRWRNGLPGAEPAHRGGVLCVRTRDGVVGRAPTSRGVIAADLVARRVRDELIGRDALHRELLWHRMWELDRIEEFPVYFLGLADVALWDIAGQLAGLPVHQLLGTYRTEIPAYASTVTYGSVEEYLDIADQCVERGFAAIKLHAWGDARRDAKLARRLREHLGDDYVLMYDGSAGFDLADAVLLGRALSDTGFLWYEEPMREFNVTSHQWLAQRVSVPLLVGETSDGAHLATADFIHSGAAAHVRTSAAFKGGVTGAMRIAHLADSFGLRAEVHGMGAASQHLCMAIRNTSFYEALVWGNPIATDAAVGPDGMVPAPTGPGMSGVGEALTNGQIS
ncbi:enolase C-terminal domain-like protein [Streptomyces sp. NPDC001978]|uniref:enolase C-terminal domain-like protein n=1 Tax=Streptomyces sp. NPDC001978 TaxID=3364627 RepID=UPI0036D091A7